MPTICHETSTPLEGASKALESLSEVGFAAYDYRFEHVFVREMAKWQIGETLTRKDNRHKAVIKELENYRKSPFFNHFLDRYTAPFNLQDVPRNEGPLNPLGSPSKAPSKPEAGSGAGTEAGSGARAGSEGPEHARVGREGKEASLPEHEAEQYRDLIQAAYPKGGNDSNWLTALKHACAIVDHGWRTWPELLADTERYASYVANGGVSAGTYILAAHNFFEVRAHGPWSRPWNPPEGKAERRLAGNVSVLSEFVAGAKP